ncbi:reverse transcriptase domain-containing protein [Tanacetum coccineum]|uniref:Reverse transcriptase domain-containing protein n=1 Tax=Tanacetum coccineum TaxID=301880 RepID=A0ABQ4WL90_9ASTR
MLTISKDLEGTLGPRIVGDDSAQSEPTEVADSNNFKPLLTEKRLKEQTAAGTRHKGKKETLDVDKEAWNKRKERTHRLVIKRVGRKLCETGLQQYLPDEVAKPIIELCSFFKKICSATLMEDDMLKAQSKVVNILCNLELIYPPAFFDIMIYLVIHLPLEALEAKPEGLIAEVYVAEEALTFSSHYFRDVTTKFNSPDRNVDPFPQRVNFSPEIDTYRSQFKSKFPNKDMKEEFPNWFG